MENTQNTAITLAQWQQYCQFMPKSTESTLEYTRAPPIQWQPTTLSASPPINQGVIVIDGTPTPEDSAQLTVSETIVPNVTQGTSRSFVGLAAVIGVLGIAALGAVAFSYFGGHIPNIGLPNIQLPKL